MIFLSHNRISMCIELELDVPLTKRFRLFNNCSRISTIINNTHTIYCSLVLAKLLKKIVWTSRFYSSKNVQQHPITSTAMTGVGFSIFSEYPVLLLFDCQV